MSQQEIVLIDSQLANLAHKDRFQILADEPTGYVRNAFVRMHAARKFRPEFTTHMFEDYVHYLHPTETYADPAIVAQNLRLLHAQNEAAGQVFQAVAVSVALAIVGLILRIIGQIWF